MGFHKALRGADLHSPSNELVENNSNSLIPKLKCVTFNGIGTVYPSIAAAVGNTDIIRGIAQTDIPDGQTGYITVLGFLTDVNTVSWSVGTKLFCGLTGNLQSAANGLPVGVVLKQSASVGVIYVDNTGITQNDIATITFPPEAELEFMFSVAYPKPYKEFDYNSTGDIVNFDVYNNSTKSVHIFNKAFTYDLSGNLTQIITTNLLTGLTKTRVIAYDSNGEMISETET